MSELVSLRKLDLARDLEALHTVFGDEESCRYLFRTATTSMAETRAMLSGWLEECPDTDWALVDASDDKCIGRISMIPREPNVFEAACMVIPAAQGRKLALKGLSQGLDFVFGEKSARRVFADIDPDNAASIKTFEKLGFKREGYFRAAYETHIGVRDAVMMSLIDSDPRPWRSGV